MSIAVILRSSQYAFLQLSHFLPAIVSHVFIRVFTRFGADEGHLIRNKSRTKMSAVVL